MAEFDASEFIDDDFQAARKREVANPFAVPADAERAPSREEVDVRVGEMQHKLSELKRVQQELERERANLEELRRRQAEFTTGREEILQNITRGVGLLEEAEFAARRDAEQMAKALVGLRDAVMKVQAIQEEGWTKENLGMELTRALTTVENARMEWNAARLKFAVLNGEHAADEERASTDAGVRAPNAILAEHSFFSLCKVGFALSWPVVVVGIAIIVVLLLR